MEESAAPVGFLGHDIRIGGVRLVGDPQMTRVNLVLATIVEDGFAEGIFADKAGGKKRKIRPEPCQANADIIRCAPGALPGLAADVSKLLPLRININEFDLIDDPIAASQQAASGGRMFSSHGETLTF
jgi:hypothetical protein